METVCCYSGECTIVEDDDTVSTLGESLHCEETVVRVDDYVASVLGVWED